MAISNLSTGLRPGVCTSTTRPSTPFEGQMIYETDTDMLAIYNGTAWRYISATTPTNGTVLQIVNATHQSLVASSSTTYVDTGLTATITPKSSSSKVLVMTDQNGYSDASAQDLTIRLVRGSTTLQTKSAAINVNVGALIFLYFDSPASTSALTYKTQISRTSGSGTVYTGYNSNIANITLMEIAG